MSGGTVWATNFWAVNFWSADFWTGSPPFLPLPPKTVIVSARFAPICTVSASFSPTETIKVNF